MRKLSRSLAIYPHLKRLKNRKLRYPIEYLDQRLQESVYNDPAFQEHVTEVSVKLGIPHETVSWVIKGYLRNVLHMLHTNVMTYSRIVVPNILLFRLHSTKHKFIKNEHRNSSS